LIERGQLVRHETTVRTLTVASVTTLSPGFVRVTMTGAELEGFASLGATDHVKAFFADDTRRDYTPRAFRPGSAGSLPELDLDFFLHGSGSASAWAARAAVGDELRVGGPRGSHLPPTGAARVILGADETALPALARWIEVLPEQTEIFGFVELSNPSDAAYLDPDHVHRARIVWLEKAEGALERAIRALGPIGDDTYLWIAGEATTLIPIRRYLRRELGLPAAQVKIDGYWKRGEAGRDHHAPLDPDDPED
jgi:NADPH-dependent ferric siderophore reductase